MNVTIDKSGCIGCGLCVEACPEVFAMGDDGLATVIAAPSADNLQAAKDAADGCPVSVIATEE